MIGEGFPLLNAYDPAVSQRNADRNMLRGLVVNLLDLSERALSGDVDTEDVEDLAAVAELWRDLCARLMTAHCHMVGA